MRYVRRKRCRVGTQEGHARLSLMEEIASDLDLQEWGRMAVIEVVGWAKRGGSYLREIVEARYYSCVSVSVIEEQIA